MHTQICPLTQGSRRGMARLKPLPPCAMYTLTSTFLILKFPTNSIQKKYIQSSKNPWIPPCQSHLPRSPALHPSRFQARPPPGRHPAVRTPDDRTNTKWLHRVDPGSSGRPHPARLPYAPGWGEGRVKLTTCSWKKGRTLRNYFFWTPPKYWGNTTEDSRQLSILEQFDNWGMDRLKGDLFVFQGRWVTLEARQRNMPDILPIVCHYNILPTYQLLPEPEINAILTDEDPSQGKTLWQRRASKSISNVDRCCISQDASGKSEVWRQESKMEYM